MLRKFVAENGMLFLLFVVYEVPQASTGFSLFELLFG